ncbi:MULTISPECIES: septum formation initiator family protein [unclassified Streptomyces]|uniref:septum formation initiator family protein n=1 Tax=Streptomyces sp. SID8367 TaxID=2690349 RepID=UPI00136A35F9|nr:septum formation initiator family protein [Streptomyces sp. PsTaAH-137]MYT70557.1 septum formation initiator family protein [Streptomyces sp. SID8367]
MARLARFLPVAPSGGSQAARTPFVLLVVLLLGGGLITLLMLNSSLNEGSFKLTKLRKQTTELTDDEQELQREVDSYSAPDALQRRARELGMVPGGDPAFLNPDGTVRGLPSPASLPLPSRQQTPRPPEAEPTAPAPSATPAPGASASAPPAPTSTPTASTPTAPAPSSSGR